MFSHRCKDSADSDERNDLRASIDSMAEGAFSDLLLESMLKLYIAEWERRGWPEAENDYNSSMEQLPKVLTEDQFKRWKAVEQLYVKEAKLSIRIAFSRGVYAAFQHCFDPSTDCTYEHLVLDGTVVESRSMVRFPDYFENRTQINRMLEQLTDELDPFSGEQLTGFACAWDERNYGMLRYGYRLGYFTAQSIMLEIDPSLRTKLAKHSWRTAGEINLPFSLD